jgi:hypothetical protein
MAVKTRGPERIFSLALPYLVGAGWLESTPPLGESANGVAESANVSAGSGKKCHIHDITRHNTTEQTPLTPQDKLGGDLPHSLDTDSFRKVWGEWQQHRSEIRKPLKPTQIKKQLKRLDELGLKRAIEALNHTIDMGWQGIREPEPEDPRKPRPKPGNNTSEAILEDLKRQTDNL